MDQSNSVITLTVLTFLSHALSSPSWQQSSSLFSVSYYPRQRRHVSRYCHYIIIMLWPWILPHKLQIGILFCFLFLLRRALDMWQRAPKITHLAGKNLKQDWLLAFSNKIQIRNRFKRTLFIGTKHNMRIFQGNDLYQAANRYSLNGEQWDVKLRHLSGFWILPKTRKQHSSSKTRYMSQFYISLP